MQNKSSQADITHNSLIRSDAEQRTRPNQLVQTNKMMIDPQAVYRQYLPSSRRNLFLQDATYSHYNMFVVIKL